MSLLASYIIARCLTYCNIFELYFTIILTSKAVFYYNLNCLGGIAQLGERLNGIQEVSGSIPLVSTKLECIQTRLDLIKFLA